MTENKPKGNHFSWVIPIFLEAGLWTLIAFGFLLLVGVYKTYSLNIWQYILGAIIWLGWVYICMIGLCRYSLKPKYEDFSAQLKASYASLDAAMQDANQQFERMNRESDERMAAFEAETQRFLEEHALPIQPDDVLDRLYDIDPNATATREADGSLTIRLHPKLTTTPK